MEIRRIVEADLRDWFKKEKWVRVDAPKKDGRYQPCGRGDTSKGKKPVCVPVNKAKNLTEKQRKNRIRQKRKKERDPNPDKKPNVTKYTEQAGGKSNVSNTTRFRIVTSNETPRFVKVALMGEENEDRTSDLTEFFDNLDLIIHEMTRAITTGSLMSISDMVGMGTTGPGDPYSSETSKATDILYSLSDANQDEMTEKEYLRYIKLAVKARKSLYEKAMKGQDAKMAEIALLLHKNNINPFNFGDVSGVVREVLQKRMK